MKTEIINTGNELVLGLTANANGVFLAKELTLLGLPVYRHTVVNDNEQEIKAVIEKAFVDSDLIFITGGLGPTVDDITKEVIADVLGLKMELHEESLVKMEAFFKARGIKMAETNRKQAMVPIGSIVLVNEVGAAPGMIIEAKGKTLVILPGPPLELEPMFKNKVVSYLKHKKISGSSSILLKTIKLWGIGESKVQEILSDLHKDFSDVEISYRATRGEVWVKLTSKEKNGGIEKVQKLKDIIVSRFGDKVFGYDDDTMESVTTSLLQKQNLTVSVAESCTGGLIAKKITDLAGSSVYFMYGVVSYSNEAKMSILGVSPKTLKKYGAVSEQTAAEMCAGVKNIGKTDLSLSVTGIAGPGGGSEDKPVGTVYIGMAHKNGTEVMKHLFYGNRENIRELTARAVLNMIRLHIAGLDSK